MTSWRSLAKDLLPPILVRTIRKAAVDQIQFVGKYQSWQRAVAASSGYDSDTIFRKTCDAALKVARGEAVYERDSVLFDHVEYAFPVIAALLRCACAGGRRLRVLDFGGALGTSYRQFKAFEPKLEELHWSIIEQSQFVEFGKKHLENDELRFFDDIPSAVRRVKPDVILLSGVLSYLEKPFSVVNELVGAVPATIIVDRTYTCESERSVLTIQCVPPSIYNASYPCWIFSRKELLNEFSRTHDLDFSFVDTASSWVGPDGAFDLAGFVFTPR